MLYRKINIDLAPQLVAGLLVARSLCACGISLIKSDVDTGTYYVDLKSVRWGKFRCAGCGAVFDFRIIDAYDPIFLTPSWFFLDLLDVGAGIPHAPKPKEWEEVRNNQVAPPFRVPGIGATVWTKTKN